MSNNVYDHPTKNFGSGGGSGDEINMRLSKLETKVDVLIPTLATKADISDTKYDIVKWLSALMVALTALGITVITFMLNRALPIQSDAQRQPIIIYPQQQITPPTPQSTPPAKR